MKIKAIYLFTLVMFSLPAIGQEKTDTPEKIKNLDFRLGAGVSFLGSGDMVTFVYENEMNYKLNQYLTSATSINLGKSNYGVLESISFVQGNLNVFLSPFKNNKRFDFRVGTGLTYYHVSNVFETIHISENGILDPNGYLFYTRESFGCNIIIENSYSWTNSFLIGLKLITQPYFNGDIHSGLLFKFGFKI